MGGERQTMANSGISAACPECETEVALTIQDGEDLMIIHVGFVRAHAAHAVLHHGRDWGAATHTAVRQYSRAYVATAVEQWRTQHNVADESTRREPDKTSRLGWPATGRRYMSADAQTRLPLTETELAAIESWASAEGAAGGPGGRILCLVAELRQMRHEYTSTATLLQLYQHVLAGRCHPETGVA
jgi:hypothetical protein